MSPESSDKAIGFGLLAAAAALAGGAIWYLDTAAPLLGAAPGPVAPTLKDPVAPTQPAVPPTIDRSAAEKVEALLAEAATQLRAQRGPGRVSEDPLLDAQEHTFRRLIDYLQAGKVAPPAAPAYTPGTAVRDASRLVEQLRREGQLPSHIQTEAQQILTTRLLAKTDPRSASAKWA